MRKQTIGEESSGDREPFNAKALWWVGAWHIQDTVRSKWKEE